MMALEKIGERREICHPCKNVGFQDGKREMSSLQFLVVTILMVYFLRFATIFKGLQALFEILQIDIFFLSLKSLFVQTRF